MGAAAGNRDNAMVALAGLHSWALVRGERTFMEAVHEMEVWVKIGAIINGPRAPRLQKAITMIGTSPSGKSQILDIIRARCRPRR